MKLVLVFGFIFYASLSMAFEPAFERAPTNYSESKAVTPLTKIADRIASGEPLLNGKTDREILDQLLGLLNVPVESQMLVYSKTSAQNSLISPRRPRAIYFSDNAYVGWVQRGNIEVITFDEKLGMVYHMVYLDKREKGKAPVIARERSCLNCHAGSATREFPGALVRSVYASGTGQPIFHAGTFRTEPSSPIEERWGGWYVTGDSGKQPHLGNQIASEAAEREVSIQQLSEGPVTDLKTLFDAEPYPAGGSSDIVALMIFEHQIHVHNTLIQGNIVARQTMYRHREMRAAFGEAADAPLSETNQSVLNGQARKILHALLSADEFDMKEEGVNGSLDFQRAFAADARKDSEGRSLRDLRLYERVFKYRCSHLIYSDAFAHLPTVLKSLVLEKLHGILTDAPSWPDFSYLSASERHRILNVLEETLPEWKAMKSEGTDVAP